MAKNNFEVNGKKYCLLVDGDNWQVTDVFGNIPPDGDSDHPDFHKTVLNKFNELKSAGYTLFKYIDPIESKKN